MSRVRLGSRSLDVASSIVAIVFGLGIGLALVAVAGAPPGQAARAMLEGAFGGSDELAATFARMVPLVLVALGWIVVYSGGLFSIGFEGQIIAGGICATTVALTVPAPAGVLLLLSILAGVAGGMAWAGIAAVLWAMRGVNEIVSTLMLNFIAILILSWMVRHPLKNHLVPDPTSRPIPSGARWPELVGNTGLNWDIFLVPVLVGAVSAVLVKTIFGFRLRLSAANEVAARSAGVHTTRVRAYGLVCSGALAGLAGSSLVLGGQSGVVADGFAGTFGYEGIAVALVARNSPWATIPSALFFSSLHQGGALMEARVGISSSLILGAQGIVIVLVAGSSVLSSRVRARRVDASGSESAPPGQTPVPAAGGAS